MRGACVVAFGALSSLGEGEGACSAGTPGEPARSAIAEDPELSEAGLARPFVARVRDEAAPAVVAGDRGTALLLRALASCAGELDEVRPGWREARVGLALGTSSGGMRSAERLFDGEAGVAAEAMYFSGMQAAVRALGVDVEPATLVLGACSSATLAIGLGMRWLAAGACDLVLAGGFDAVSVFVAAGFEVLRATSAAIPPRPFCVGRDGMALGEGAAVLALVRPADPCRSGCVHVAGFGASADAVHLTAPDRTGGGLARAAEAALVDAGLTGADVDLVSAHGTATPFNDAAEARAIARVLGDARRGDARAVVHPFKAQIGHTLGAAGALEALACVDALARGVLPASAGQGALDPDADVRLLDVAARGEPRAALKLSAAFGGANAALVLAAVPVPVPAESGAPTHGKSKGTSTHSPREAYLYGAVHIPDDPAVAQLAADLHTSVDRVARLDGLCRRALAAVALLASRHPLADHAGSPSVTAVVVGQAFATLETNLLFHKRIRMRGARLAEPRRFPYTSPNAVAGEVSVAFALTGPSFAVGSGLHAGVEALAVAIDLVRAGDADRVVVVASDEVGEAVALARIHPDFAAFSPVSGAVAVLVGALGSPVDRDHTRSAAVARIRRTRLCMQGGRGHGLAAPREPVLVGHLALVPLATSSLPSVVESSMPLRGGGVAHARVELERL